MKKLRNLLQVGTVAASTLLAVTSASAFWGGGGPWDWGGGNSGWGGPMSWGGGNSGWGSPMGWGGGYPGYGGWGGNPGFGGAYPYAGGNGYGNAPYPGGYGYGVAPYQGGANYQGGAAGYPVMPMTEQSDKVPAAQLGQVPAYK